MTANDLIYKSIYIITEYYNNNLQPYFDNISEDVLWILALLRDRKYGDVNRLFPHSQQRYTD